MFCFYCLFSFFNINSTSDTEFKCVCVCECVYMSWPVVLVSLLHAECCIRQAGDQMSHIYHMLTQRPNGGIRQTVELCAAMSDRNINRYTLISAQAWANPFIVRDRYTLPSRVFLPLCRCVECVSLPLCCSDWSPAWMDRLLLSD